MSETIEQSAKRAWIEVATLREQVEKLTKERDIKEHCIVQLEAEDLRAKEQLAALAEQNEKMRHALTKARFDSLNMTLTDWDILKSVANLPDLASPVLNRIRAEGMRMAAETCATSEIPFDIELWASSTKQEMTAHTANTLAEMLRARAAELEKTNE